MDKTNQSNFVTSYSGNLRKLVKNPKRGKQFTCVSPVYQREVISNLAYMRNICASDNSQFWFYFCQDCQSWFQLFDTHVCSSSSSTSYSSSIFDPSPSLCEWSSIYTQQCACEATCSCSDDLFFLFGTHDLPALFDEIDYLRTLDSDTYNVSLGRHFCSVLDEVENTIYGITPPSSWVQPKRSSPSRFFKSDDFAIIEAANNAEFWGEKWTPLPCEQQGKSPSTIHRENHHGHTWKQCLINPSNVGYYHTQCAKCSVKVKFVNKFGVCKKCSRSKRNACIISAESQMFNLDNFFSSSSLKAVSDVCGRVDNLIDSSSPRLDSVLSNVSSLTDSLRSAKDFVTDKISQPGFLLSLGAGLATLFTEVSTPLRVLALINLAVSVVGYANTYEFLKDRVNDTITFISGATASAADFIRAIDFFKPSSSDVVRANMEIESDTLMKGVSFIGSIIGMLVVGRLSFDGLDFDKFLRRTALVGNSLRSCQTLFDYIQASFNSSFDYCCTKLNVANPLHDSLPEDVRVFNDTAMKLINQPITTETYAAKYAGEISALLTKGNVLRSSASRYRYPTPVMSILNSTFDKLYRKNSSLAGLAVELAPRVEPLVVYLTGPAGAGKSGLIFALTAAVCALEGIDPSKWSSIVYQRTVENVFWENGNSGHKILWYDEFAQRRDTPTAPNPEIMELLKLCNIVPYNLHMADIDSKGRCFANYTAIFVTSNTAMPPVAIEHSEAFYRRICQDFHVTISIKPEFLIPGTEKVDSAKATAALDGTDLEGKLNPLIYLLKVKCTHNRPMVENKDPNILPYSYVEGNLMDGTYTDRECYNVYGWYDFLSVFVPAYKARVFDKIALSKSVESIGKDTSRFLNENFPETISANAEGLLSFAKSCVSYKPRVIEPVFHDAIDPIAYAQDYLNGKCAFDAAIVDNLRALDQVLYSQYVYCDGLTDDERQTLVFNLYRLFNTGQLTPHLGRSAAVDKIFAKLCALDIAVKQYTAGRQIINLPGTLYAAAQSLVDGFKTGGINAPFGSWSAFLTEISGELFATTKILASLTPVGFIVNGTLTPWQNAFFSFMSLSSMAFINSLNFDWDVASHLYVSVHLPVSNITTFEVFSYRYSFGEACFLETSKRCKNFGLIKEFLIRFKKYIRLQRVDASMAYYLATHEIETMYNVTENELFSATSSSLHHFNNLFGTCDYWTAFYQNIWSLFSWPRYLSSHSGPLSVLYTFLGYIPAIAQSLLVLLGGGMLFTGMRYSVSFLRKWWFGNISSESQIKQSAIDYCERVKSRAVNPESKPRSVPVVKSSAEAYPNGVSRKQVISKVEGASLYSPPSKNVDVIDEILEANDVKITAFDQALKDNCTDVMISNRVQTNLYSFCTGAFVDGKFVRGDTLFTGWFICGTVVLICSHFIPTLLHMLERDIKVFMVNFSGEVIDPVTNDNISTIKTITDRHGKPSDIAVICFDYKIICPRPSIRKHFITNDELSKCQYADAILVGLRDYKDKVYLSTMNNLILDLAIEKSSAFHGKTLGYGECPDSDEHMYNHASYISYVAATKSGDCGSLLLLLEQKFRNKIVGMHVAGNVIDIGGGTKGYGFSVPVTKERIDFCLQDIDRRFTSSSPSLPGVAAFIQAPEGAFLPIGVNDFTSGMVASHNFGPSPISGVLQEPKCGRSVLRNYCEPATGEIVDVRYKSLSKAGTQSGLFEPERLTHVSDSICDMYFDLALQSVEKGLLKPSDFVSCVSDTVAIKGDGRFSSPLVLSTSPGLPFIHMKEGVPGKRNFINEEGVMSKELQDIVDASIETMSQGRRCDVLWQDLCKSERRPLEKVAAGKTRTIVSSPVHFTVILRKFMMFFLKIQQASVIKCQSSIGTNVYSYAHGHGLAVFLREKGDKFLAGDFEQWDGHNSFQALMECMVMVNKLIRRLYKTFESDLCEFLCVTPEKLYTDLERDCIIREMCSFDISSSVHLLDSFVYMWTHGMPSGCLLTACFNTLLNQFYFYYAWDELAPTKFRGFDKYLEHVRANFLGDDNVLGVSDAAIPFYNMVTLQTCFRSHELFYTDARKTKNAMVPYIPFSEISYLKRTPIFSSTQFVKWEAPRWIWALDQDVIREMPNWVSNGPVKSLVPQVVDDCLREASLWGKDFFDDCAEKLRDACASKRISFVNNGFLRTRQFVLSGEYTPFV